MARLFCINSFTIHSHSLQRSGLWQNSSWNRKSGNCAGVYGRVKKILSDDIYYLLVKNMWKDIPWKNWQSSLILQTEPAK